MMSKTVDGSGEAMTSKTALQGPSLMSRMALNDNKAGMEGLDKEKINQIIYNASKGSKFYENERKKEEQWNEKIKEQKLLASRIGLEKLRQGEHQADVLLEKLLQQRDLNHTIVHIDMDAFYAAVEMRDDPTLKTKPMAVGGMGMLSTSNYLARKYGVRAAMPGFIGLKLCPELVMVRPNFEKYTAVSQEIRQVLAVYDPNFCPMSLDEAYLDFGPHLQYRASSPASARTFILRLPEDMEASTPTLDHQDAPQSGKCRCDLNCVLLPAFLDLEEFSTSSFSEQHLQAFVHGFDSKHSPDQIPKVCGECQRSFPNYCLKVYGLSIEDAVLEMRNRIEQRTFLTASAGIAPNTMLAKVCSDKNKPNGQFRILQDVHAVEEFVRDLPIRKISGVGKVTEKLLGALGVTNCSDIYEHRALLYHLHSPTSFHYFMRIYLGMGSTVVQRDDERKSISTERTFSELSDKEELCRKCEEMSQALAEDLKDEHLKGKTVTLKIKCVSFEVKTRSHTLQKSTSDPSLICATARQLLLTEIKNALPAPLRLRLMGVRMSKLEQEEKREVTVKDMFEKLKTGSSSSYDNGKSADAHTDSHKYSLEDDGLQLLPNTSDFTTVTDTRTQDNSDVITLADDSPTKKNTSMESKNIQSRKTKLKSSVALCTNIEKFFTKENSMKDQKQGCTPALISSAQFCCRGNVYSSSQFTDTDRISSPVEVFQTPYSHLELNSPETNFSDKDTNFQGDSPSKELTCPVCGDTDEHWDLTSLNAHMDVCLSQQTIKEMLHNDKAQLSSDDAESSSSSYQSNKNKRIRSETQSGQHGQDKPKKIQRTVVSFFHR